MRFANRGISRVLPQFEDMEETFSGFARPSAIIDPMYSEAAQETSGGLIAVKETGQSAETYAGVVSERATPTATEEPISETVTGHTPELEPEHVPESAPKLEPELTSKPLPIVELIAAVPPSETTGSASAPQVQLIPAEQRRAAEVVAEDARMERLVCHCSCVLVVIGPCSPHKHRPRGFTIYQSVPACATLCEVVARCGRAFHAVV